MLIARGRHVLAGHGLLVAAILHARFLEDEVVHALDDGRVVGAGDGDGELLRSPRAVLVLDVDGEGVVHLLAFVQGVDLGRVVVQFIAIGTVGIEDERAVIGRGRDRAIVRILRRAVHAEAVGEGGVMVDVRSLGFAVRRELTQVGGVFQVARAALYDVPRLVAAHAGLDHIKGGSGQGEGGRVVGTRNGDGDGLRGGRLVLVDDGHVEGFGLGFARLQRLHGFAVVIELVLPFPGDGIKSQRAVVRSEGGGGAALCGARALRTFAGGVFIAFNLEGLLRARVAVGVDHFESAAHRGRVAVFRKVLFGVLNLQFRHVVGAVNGDGDLLSVGRAVSVGDHDGEGFLYDSALRQTVGRVVVEGVDILALSVDGDRAVVRGDGAAQAVAVFELVVERGGVIVAVHVIGSHLARGRELVLIARRRHGLAGHGAVVAAILHARFLEDEVVRRRDFRPVVGTGNVDGDFLCVPRAVFVLDVDGEGLGPRFAFAEAVKFTVAQRIGIGAIRVDGQIAVRSGGRDRAFFGVLHFALHAEAVGEGGAIVDIGPRRRAARRELARVLGVFLFGRAVLHHVAVTVAAHAGLDHLKGGIIEAEGGLVVGAVDGDGDILGGGCAVTVRDYDGDGFGDALALRQMVGRAVLQFIGIGAVLAHVDGAVGRFDVFGKISVSVLQLVVKRGGVIVAVHVVGSHLARGRELVLVARGRHILAGLSALVAAGLHARFLEGEVVHALDDGRVVGAGDGDGDLLLGGRAVLVGHGDGEGFGSCVAFLQLLHGVAVVAERVFPLPGFGIEGQRAVVGGKGGVGAAVLAARAVRTLAVVGAVNMESLIRARIAVGIGHAEGAGHALRAVFDHVLPGAGDRQFGLVVGAGDGDGDGPGDDAAPPVVHKDGEGFGGRFPEGEAVGVGIVVVEGVGKGAVLLDGDGAVRGINGGHTVARGVDKAVGERIAVVVRGRDPARGDGFACIGVVAAGMHARFDHADVAGEVDDGFAVGQRRGTVFAQAAPRIAFGVEGAV